MVDRIQMLDDRDAGMTYKQIAAKHGVSYQFVGQVCGRYNPLRFRYITEVGCIYPNLRKWMNDGKVSRSELLRMMCFEKVPMNIAKLSSIMNGETLPKKDWIDAMLAATGMSYERLFSEKAWGGKNGK